MFALAQVLLPLLLPRVAQRRDARALLDRMAEARGAGQEIDGRLVLDELVLFGAPLELFGRLRAGVNDAGDAEPHRRQRARLGEVDLHAVTALLRVLVPRRRERGRP